jgi:hypothetical protein
VKPIPVRSEVQSGDDFWADPFGGGGYLILDEPDKRVWLKRCEDGKLRARTLERWDALFEQNKARYNENAGQKFGDMAQVADIPASLYFRKFAEARNNGDDKYIRKILNDSDYRNLRTRPGKL